MGRIAAPFGVKGWVKVQPFSAAPENLLAYPVWSPYDAVEAADTMLAMLRAAETTDHA